MKMDKYNHIEDAKKRFIMNLIVISFSPLPSRTVIYFSDIFLIQWAQKTKKLLCSIFERNSKLWLFVFPR